MKRILLALPLMAALPFAANAAEGVSYNYVEGGYTATNTDGGDADGFGGNASVAVHPNFHLFGGYQNQEIEDSNVDFDQWRAGVGYNHPVTTNTDLVTRVAYEKFQADSVGVDTDGYSAEVGVRSALTTNLEGYALAGYEDGDEFDGDVYGRLGGQYKFTPNWGISGDVKVADGDTQWFVGPRFTW
jgi:Ax21 family sulfation-dependent quorum factor